MKFTPETVSSLLRFHTSAFSVESVFLSSCSSSDRNDSAIINDINIDGDVPAVINRMFEGRKRQIPNTESGINKKNKQTHVALNCL